VRTLLFELPFKRTETPSLGLTLLRDIACERHHDIAINYANLQFENRIGSQRYAQIVHGPSELLLGDLVFAGAAFDRWLTPDDQKCLRRLGHIGNRSVDLDIINDLPELQELASLFVSDVAKATAHEAEIHGFSMMFQVTPSLAVAKAIKALNPRAIVVVGGPHCADSMGRALLRRCTWIDYVCPGEGESAFSDLLDALRPTGESHAGVPGIVSRGTLVSTPARSANLDALPIPRFDDWRRQRGSGEQTTFIAPFEASRGCWFGEKSHCVFCGLNGEMMTFRSKSASRVLDEIESLTSAGAEHLEAADQILDPKYLTELFPEITRRNLSVSFFFEVKSTLSRAQLQTLRDANVVRIQPGIESLSTGLLIRLRKGAKSYQNIRLLKWCAELGIAASWNFLTAVPGETLPDYTAIASLIPKLTHLQPPGASIRPVRVDRFSPLWKQSFTENGLPIAPAPTYELVYGTDPKFLADIAYHFEFVNRLPNLALKSGCAAAMDCWCSSVGASSLTLCRPNGTQPGFVCDGRGTTVKLVELNEVALFILDRCDAGISWDSLCRDSGVTEADLRAELNVLLDLAFVIEIDGILLSLPVDLSALLRDFPIAIAAPVAHAVYCSRMTSLCSGADRVWPRDSEANAPRT